MPDMKSLIQKPQQKPAEKQCCTPAKPEKVAQCCAKISKAVAGCHD